MRPAILEDQLWVKVRRASEVEPVCRLAKRHDFGTVGAMS